MNTAVTRQILWNVSPAATTALYVLAAVTGAWIVLWFARRAKRWALGRSAPSQTGWASGLRRLGRYLGTHKVIRRDRYAGVMHALVFWGFCIELLATTLVAIQHDFHVEFLVGNTYRVFALVSDLGGVALIAGLAMALWRRSPAARLGRLAPSWRTSAVLWLLLVVAVGGFVVEGARIAVAQPGFERWSVVGYAVAKLFVLGGIAGQTLLNVHHYLWLFHAAAAIAFLVAIPITIMRHIVLGGYSVMRPVTSPGRLSLPVANGTTSTGLGDFSRLDLVETDACLTCGRCTEVCPAEAAGKPLSPRQVVLGVRSWLDSPSSSPTHHVADAALWSCTTCHACEVACPVDIHIVDKITTLRRARVLEGVVASTAADALESTAQKFNPFDKPNSSRMDWASGLTVPIAKPDEAVDLLYWVGCSGAFDPAGREVTRAMVKIFERLRIDYRVLGRAERCTGDPARRMGEEELWKELAAANRLTFAAHKVKTILTQCPHCVNSFAREYTELGPMPRVVHHSQWLKERLDDGSLSLGASTGDKITFHDPCYLSRASNEIEAPRAVLDQLGTRVEMTRHGKNSFCCGGGGGQMWLDVRGKTRVENLRAAQAEATAARTVATGCPFCRVMMEAGRSQLPDGQGKWQVRDVAELVADSLGKPP